ncbi:MAG: hypothetical protein ABI367_08610 [Mucilaginibacter sp.]
MSKHSAGLCPLLFSVVLMFTHTLVIVKTPSAKQLRAKSGKTMVACAAAGHCNFLLKHRHERTKWGKNIAAQVLPDLQGEGPARQRSLLADLIFGYFLSRESN